MRGFVHELRQAAKQWVTRGKPADLVWRGATAQEALLHAKRHVLDLSAAERAFLAAIAAQTSRVRRRRVYAVAAIFVALGLVIAAGSIALVEIRAAESRAIEKANALEDALAKTKQAEQLRATAERSAVDANKAQSQTKEQLVVANRELEEKLHELEVANEKAKAEEQRARDEEKKARGEETRAKKATEEALAARKKLEEMLDAKRKEIETLQKKMKDIIDVDLRGKK